MKKFLRKIYKLIYKFKIFFYHDYLSTINIDKNAILNTPTLFIGKGKIKTGINTTFGYFPSAYYYSTYCHIEARHVNSKIIIGDRTIFNNNCNIVAETNTIDIGSDCIIGANFTCFDFDFHSLNPNKRGDFSSINRADIKIGNNVFIGNNVTILKGVNIGDGCTIAFGSVVTKSFPKNTIIAGNPAKAISILQNYK